MQRNISNNVQLSQSSNPLKDAMGVESVDYLADFNNMLEKIDKLKILYNQGSMDSDMLKYIPGLAKIFYQGQIDAVETKKTYAATSYTDKEVLEFNVNLLKNHYTNFSSILLCLPIKILKKVMQQLMQMLI